jgi:hypothetical protein
VLGDYSPNSVPEAMVPPADPSGVAGHLLSKDQKLDHFPQGIAAVGLPQSEFLYNVLPFGRDVSKTKELPFMVILAQELVLAQRDRRT